MSEQAPDYRIQHSHFWVFTEQQLAAALADWGAQMVDNGLGSDGVDLLTEGVSKFLHSDYCIDQGMRRGGTEQTP